MAKAFDISMMDVLRRNRAGAAPMEGFTGLVRRVRHNDRAVRVVPVGGTLAVVDGQPVLELGKARGFGRVLRDRA